MIVREMRRFIKGSPLLSASAVIVVALGFSVSTMGFVLLLAFSSLTSPGMKNMHYATIAEPTEGGRSAPLSWSRYEELLQSRHADIVLTAYSRPIKVLLGPVARKKQITIQVTSANFFSLLDTLVVGRTFSTAEELTSGSHQIILSYKLATASFHTPGAALEQVILLNDLPFEVVGVAPKAFDGTMGDLAEAWVPANCITPLLIAPPADSRVPPEVWKTIPAFFVIAGSPGMTTPSLLTDLQKAILNKRPDEADLHVSRGITNDPPRDEQLRRWSRLGLTLALLFATVSCLDVCLLLLARAPVHLDEVRIKRALGASPWRLVLESMVGPAAVMSLGVGAASAMVVTCVHLIERMSPFYDQLLRGAGGSLAFALVIQPALAGLIIVGTTAIPAWYLRTDTSLPSTGYSTTANRRTDTLMQIPVALQIAFCITTCVLAGMIVSSLLSMLRRPLGYRPDNLKVISIAPAGGLVHFETGAEGTSPEMISLQHIAERIRGLPGVESVSFVSDAPFNESGAWVEQLQRSDDSSSAARSVASIAATPEYFKTVGSRILAGSDLPNTTDGDYQIVVNELLAKEFFGAQNPVGHKVKLLVPAWSGIPAYQYSATIIGVVENMRLSGLLDSPEPTFYMSSLGHPFAVVRPQLVVRGSTSSSTLREIASKEVPRFMKGMGVNSVYDVEPLVKASIAPEKQRVYWALLGALIMAAIAYTGLYGALTYYVRSRRRDLAVRICMGASRFAIREIIIKRASRCAGLASLLAVPLTISLKQLSSSQFLGEVSWSGTRTIATFAVCILVATTVSLIPARMANSLSLAEILKEQ